MNANTLKDKFKITNLLINERPINSEEEKQLNDFLNILTENKKIQFIYRGENNLQDIYKTDTSNIPLLSDFIFILGEKGKCFRNAPKNKDELIEDIWDKLSDKICKVRLKSQNSRRIISDFLKENKGFESFFLDEGNKDKFIEILKKDTNAFDYYLTFLHTVGNSTNKNSHLLSTSLSYEIAKKFSGDGIILFGWTPTLNKITHTTFSKNRRQIKSLGLPLYKQLYPHQKEICLKCGLLPHFTIGFQHQENFYINPNIFKTWDKNVCLNGLEIDQSKFNDLFNDSKYKQNFIRLNKIYYIFDGNQLNIL